MKQWEKGSPGKRLLIPYTLKPNANTKVASIRASPTDFESLEKAAPVLEACIVFVAGAQLYDLTTKLAFDTVRDKLELIEDDESISYQGYMFNAMCSHLRKCGREGRTSHKHPKVYELAKKMK